MAKPSPKALAIAAVVVVAVLNGFIFAWRYASPRGAQPQSVERKVVRTSAPELMARIDKDIAGLQNETLAESLQRLSDVNMFYWPGPSPAGASVVTSYIPLDAGVGDSDIDAIMSSRRFRKLLDELGRLDSTAASKNINEELSAATAEYLEIYEQDVKRLSAHFEIDKVSGQSFIAGPTFEIDNVPEGKLVIAGARLKVLSLVWIAGILKLDECKSSVENVARVARKQRDALYGDQSLHPFFRSQMLKLASVYNRRILISALHDVSADGVPVADVMEAAGIEWQERQLASYKAELTEFDLPVQSGVARPDYSRGSVTVRVVSPIDDQQFDALMEKLSTSL